MEGNDPKAGGFQPGNALWKLRDPAKGHRPLIYSDPHKLTKDCIAYFEWADANPLIEERVFSSNGVILRANVKKMRPYTIEGLCVFLGINRTTWFEYRDREGFRDAVAQIDMAIFEQKFSAAAVGLMDPVFMGKHLGLVDKRELAGGISLTVAPEDAGL